MRLQTGQSIPEHRQSYSSGAGCTLKHIVEVLGLLWKHSLNAFVSHAGFKISHARHDVPGIQQVPAPSNKTLAINMEVMEVAKQ